jgi:WD40 repeat protein
VRLGELNESLEVLSNDRECQAVEAERNRQQAEDVAFLSSQREFSAEIMQASSHWLNARTSDRNEVLMRFHPLSKESSLPDFAQRFEWNDLWRQGANLRAWKRHDASVAAVAVSLNHQTAFTIGNDDRIVSWDVASGLPRYDWLLPRKNDASEYVISRAPVHAVTFSPDPKTLSAALHDGRVLKFQPGD